MVRVDIADSVDVRRHEFEDEHDVVSVVEVEFLIILDG